MVTSPNLCDEELHLSYSFSICKIILIPYIIGKMDALQLVKVSLLTDSKLDLGSMHLWQMSKLRKLNGNTQGIAVKVLEITLK